jgi:hypothetical protein
MRLKHFVVESSKEVEKEILDALDVRTSFDELTKEDWGAWLHAATERDPQTRPDDREIIRGLYACLLERFRDEEEKLVFSAANVWWVERLDDRENWSVATPELSDGSYLDRAEYEKLTLPGLLVFPARLDEKEARAEKLFGIDRLSSVLLGVPTLQNSCEDKDITDRIHQRSGILATYLGLGSTDAKREQISLALQSATCLRTADLIVAWRFRGRTLAERPEESHVYQSEAGNWHLILRGSCEQRHAEERAAELVLHSCGHYKPREVANIRDLLFLPLEEARQKLIHLGVAPETVEDVIRQIEQVSVPSAAPAPLVLVPDTVPDPVLGPSVSATSVPLPTSPPAALGISVPDTAGQSSGSADRKTEVSAKSKQPSSSAKPHPETGIPAQNRLLNDLRDRFEGQGWQISSEVGDDETGSRTDIVMKHVETREVFIEVKSLNASDIFWSDLQIRTAQRRPARYFMALMIGDEVDVSWLFDPLHELACLPRKISWRWNDLPERGDLDEQWQPTSSPPHQQAEHYKVVVTVPQSFSESLPKGLEVLSERLGRLPGEG